MGVNRFPALDSGYQKLGDAAFSPKYICKELIKVEMISMCVPCKQLQKQKDNRKRSSSLPQRTMMFANEI